MSLNNSFVKLSLLAAVVILINGCSSFSIVKRNKVQFKEAVAISLRELIATLKSDTLADSIKSRASHLFGISKIYGYVDDVPNKDIILIGARCTNANEILIEDCAELLKNASGVQESPGCSIDPTAAERDSLDKLIDKLNCFQDAFIKDRFLMNWKKNPSFHRTRIMGINKKSHLAKVMIDADYLMKNVSVGNCRYRVKGFNSYMDLTLSKTMEKAKKHEPLENESIFVRFWFSPTSFDFLRNGSTTMIKSGSVQLLTEQMYWNDKNENVGLNRTYPLAEEFAKQFSEHYYEISKIEPIYAQLETLYRLYSLQKAIENSNLFRKYDLDIAYIADHYSAIDYSVPDSLPGIYAFSRLYEQDDRYQYEALVPIAGGVVINPSILEECIKTDTTGIVLELEKAIFKFKPKQKAIWWSFQLPAKIYPYFI